LTDGTTGTDGAPAPTPYSRAYEQIVRSGDDLVGLVGYALYKKTVRSRIVEGRGSTPAQSRNLTEGEVELYRNRADSYLKRFADTSLREAEPTMIQTMLLQEVRKSTGFWYPGVVVGIVAWLVSIAITICATYVVPDVAHDIVHHLQPKTAGEQTEPPAPAPSTR
jgi:hypothetical protein